MPLDFLGVAQQIVTDRTDLRNCRPVVEKELLHLEILKAMREAGHMRHLAFKGGTCLRLCHGSPRFSEDLDFSGGEAFQPGLLNNLEEALRDGIASRYGLELSVTPPKQMRSVNRWVARVTTRPPKYPGSTSNIGIQRIKIEVDDSPVPEGTLSMPLIAHHGRYLGSYGTATVRAVPLEYVLKEKLVAFPQSVVSRRNPRYRDMWDIAWLANRVSDHKGALRAAIATAERDGMGTDEYLDAQERTIERVEEMVDSAEFSSNLRRFLSDDEFGATISDAGYRRYIAQTVKGLLGFRLQQGLMP